MGEIGEAIVELDNNVGTVMDTLKDLGIDEDTVVMSWKIAYPSVNIENKNENFLKTKIEISENHKIEKKLNFGNFLKISKLKKK